ncbi:MAG: hypothetical protein GY830_06895 [Bacteroidetes bacterium]|nr:hypothetical protein [Bacteroidota bacterium]
MTKYFVTIISLCYLFNCNKYSQNLSMNSNKNSFSNLVTSFSELELINERLPKADKKELFEGFDCYLNMYKETEQMKIIEVFKYLEQKNILLQQNKENIINLLYKTSLSKQSLIKEVTTLINKYIGFKDNTHLLYLNTIKNNINFQKILNYYNTARKKLNYRKAISDYKNALLSQIWFKASIFQMENDFSPLNSLF